jgi:hypothetical protein
MRISDLDALNPPGLADAARRVDRRRVIFWFALLTALAAAAAYLRMMTDFSPWDDEGTLMFTVKQYMAGMKCYDQILSPYGPVYYFYQWAIHRLTATPVTHDVVRICALLPWLCAALISSWMTLRLTRSLVLAALVHLGASLVLGFFKDEPGHPQELTLVLLAALAALPVFAGLQHGRAVLLAGLGMLPALLFLIKVNIGAFAVAAVAMTLLSSGPRTRAWLALALAAATACIALPPLLMRSHLDADWARSYCWLEVASIGGCVCCLMRTRDRALVTARDCMLVVGCFVATFSVVMAILLAQGVSIPAVYDSLLAAPARIYLSERTWFRAPWILKGTSLWAAVGLGGAVLTAWIRPLRGTAPWRVLFACKTVFCAVALITFLVERPFLSIVTPFAWLLLFDPRQTDDQSQFLPRRLLSILAVLQTLYAYPIAGSQGAFIQILPMILVGVCVGDSISWLADSRFAPRWGHRWQGVAATLALAAVALAQVKVVVNRYWIYQSLPSLDLPGARLVHTAPDVKVNFQWLVANIREHCDSFESLPGLPSLSFWTGIETLTRFNIGAWTYTLSPDQQQQVVAAISRHPRACIVYNRPLTEFWNPGGKSLGNLPLVAYIFRNFQAVGSSGDYRLMLRSERIGTSGSR